VGDDPSDADPAAYGYPCAADTYAAADGHAPPSAGDRDLHAGPTADAYAHTACNGYAHLYAGARGHDDAYTHQLTYIIPHAHNCRTADQHAFSHGQRHLDAGAAYSDSDPLGYSGTSADRNRACEHAGGCTAPGAPRGIYPAGDSGAGRRRHRDIMAVGAPAALTAAMGWTIFLD
jgi:hypothetical protein